MPNKIYYKIPHEVASASAHRWQMTKYGHARQIHPFKGSEYRKMVTVKTKLSKLATIQRDLDAAGIYYTVETTDTHVIIHN